MNTLLQRDLGVADHLAPLRGLIDDLLCEFGGRHRSRLAADLRQQVARMSVAKSGAYVPARCHFVPPKSDTN